MFSNIIEKIFSGFNIGYDTKLIDDLPDDEKALIIKKSRKFIILRPISLFNLLGIILISAANSVIFFFGGAFPLELKAFLIISYIINIVVWLISILSYLDIFNKNYSTRDVKTTIEWKEILQKGDVIFKKFYNQTIFILVFYFILIVIFAIATFMYYAKFKTIDMILIPLNCFLFLMQSIQIKGLLGNFINLEMDFTVITKKFIRHIDQMGIVVKSLTVEMEKVKSIKSGKDGFIGSLFNYGNIEILAEGDAQGNADLVLQFIDNPEEVENSIYKIRSED